MNRAGRYTVNLSGEAEYRSFCPSPLPPSPPIDLGADTQALLTEVSKKLAVLDGLSSRIPDIKLFVSMYVRKEALVSSQIEGTQCTLEDVLDPNIEKNANLDVSDVVNYIAAFNYAEERLKDLPLCNRLIKEVHAVLMQGVRGGEKTPGEFRTSQNWIGGAGSSIKTARYIPPNPEEMEEAMSELEKYINSDDSLDPIVRAALIHYQFETIHPFLDGNGRVGRLLIVLFLIEQKIISSPVLYLSCFLKMNRVEYYDRMTTVRKTGNYEQWVTFFVEIAAQAAEDALETIDALLQLHSKNLKKIRLSSARTAAKLERLFIYAEKNPILDIGRTAAALEMSYNTAAKYIGILCSFGILKNSEKQGKTQLFYYNDYLEILKKNTELI